MSPLEISKYFGFGVVLGFGMRVFMVVLHMLLRGPSAFIGSD